jgi:hypothetical protein
MKKIYLLLFLFFSIITKNHAQTSIACSNANGTTVTLELTGCTGLITWQDGPYSNPRNVFVADTYIAFCGMASYSITLLNLNTCPAGGGCALTAATDKPIIPAGASATLSATGCSGTVTWSNAAGNVGTGASLSVSPTASTIYTADCSVLTCTETVEVKVQACRHGRINYRKPNQFTNQSNAHRFISRSCRDFGFLLVRRCLGEF